MADIGIRELKIHASEILHQVKEKGARYVVTHHGHPVAVIIPVGEAQSESYDDRSTWDELIELGEQIGQNWETEQSSTDILSDLRR